MGTYVENTVISKRFIIGELVTFAKNINSMIGNCWQCELEQNTSQYKYASQTVLSHEKCESMWRQHFQFIIF